MAFGPPPIPIDPFYPGQQEQPGAAPCSWALFFFATSCATALCLCRTNGLCTNIMHATRAMPICCSCVGIAQLYFTSSVLRIWGCTPKDRCCQNILDFESADQLSWACPTLTDIAGVCVWNDGANECTISFSATGEGRQGVAIPWDQKKVNDPVSYKGWPLQPK